MASNPIDEATQRRHETITALLMDLRAGDQQALHRLIPLVYDDLQAIAHRRLVHERAGHTLNTTALVHEAYVRLARQREAQWKNRGHFFAVAAQAMRRILVDYAAKHKALKRGGGVPRLSLDDLLHGDAPLFSEERADEVLALDDALARLEAFNERGCRVVEYRFFAGLTYDEIAEVMGLSSASVRRAWTAVRLWLRRELHEPPPP